MKKNMQKIFVATIMSLSLGLCAPVSAMQRMLPKVVACSLGGLSTVPLAQPLYKQYKSYSLHRAITTRDTVAVRSLVKQKGVDLERLHEGQTPLEHAMQLENWDYAHILAQSGAQFTPKARELMHEKMSHTMGWA